MDYKKLKDKFNDRFLKDVSAKDITTYKAGGIVSALIYVETAEEIEWLVKECKSFNMPFFILGEGSNVLVGDMGFEGVFISLKKMDSFKIEGEKAEAFAGAVWDKFVESNLLSGNAGAENTSYIPGSVGGAVRMNAGAYDCETFDCLESFKVFDIEDLCFKEIFKKDIKYGYRYVENIKRYIILSAKFVFKKGDTKKLIEKREEIIFKRKEKQPLEYPSAGSVFKRPKDNFASKLIDICGLKGLRIGGAVVSEKHAGFIVNDKNATAKDIRDLILKVKKMVFEKTKVLLEEEQIFIGEF